MTIRPTSQEQRPNRFAQQPGLSEQRNHPVSFQTANLPSIAIASGGSAGSWSSYPCVRNTRDGSETRKRPWAACGLRCGTATSQSRSRPGSATSVEALRALNNLSRSRQPGWIARLFGVFWGFPAGKSEVLPSMKYTCAYQITAQAFPRFGRHNSPTLMLTSQTRNHARDRRQHADCLHRSSQNLSRHQSRCRAHRRRVPEHLKAHMLGACVHRRSCNFRDSARDAINYLQTVPRQPRCRYSDDVSARGLILSADHVERHLNRSPCLKWCSINPWR
jgi:hypothetical protein